jgi:hypothetical protein
MRYDDSNHAPPPRINRWWGRGIHAVDLERARSVKSSVGACGCWDSRTSSAYLTDSRRSRNKAKNSSHNGATWHLHGNTPLNVDWAIAIVAPLKKKPFLRESTIEAIPVPLSVE